MTVPFDPGAEMEDIWSEPRLLFDGIVPPTRAGSAGRSARNYDVDNGGQRFLMVLEDSEDGEGVVVIGPVEQKVELILVQNWSEEFERLGPTR